MSKVSKEEEAARRTEGSCSLRQWPGLGREENRREVGAESLDGVIGGGNSLRKLHWSRDLNNM